MTNQLEVIKESNLGTMFEPAVLEVHQFDEMKATVQKFADKYTNLAFTAADKKGAEEVRGSLIEIREKFETERKIIKKAYNEPLNAYEAKIKELNALIDVPLNQIRDGLKEIENGEREMREELLKETLAIKLEGLDVAIEPKANWLNKGMWTSKLKPTTKLNEEIDGVIDAALKEKKRREAEIKVLNEFCKAKEIDPAGWVSQLDFKSATEVIDLINLDMERKARLAIEQEQKKAEYEAYRAKQAETLAEIEQPEVIDPFVEVGVLVNVIRVKGTQNQLNKLNKFLIANEIGVELVSDETGNYMMDDLPF